MMASSATYVAGMGRIGLPMALRLLETGYEVVAAPHRDRSWCADFEAAGGRVMDTPDDALDAAETLLLALPSMGEIDAFLEACGALGENGIELVINHSTVAPDEARDLAVRLEAAGCHVVDAPVSGGPAKARAGQLTMAISGSEEACRLAGPYLEALGGSVFHVAEEAGTGQVLKLCNNMINAIATVASGEAIKIVEKAGLDPDVLRSFVLESSGANFPMANVLSQTTLQGSYSEPLFALGLMCKDLQLLREFRTGLPVRCTVSAVTQELFDAAKAAGLSDQDYSVVVESTDVE